MSLFGWQTKTRSSGQDIVGGCLRRSAWIGPDRHCHPSPVILLHPSSSVFCQLSSVIRYSSSDIRHPLSSVILCFPSSSAILPHHPSSVILCHLSSIICHPSSIISHPSSSVIHHPLSSIILVILRHPLFVFCHPCLSSFILHPSSVTDTHFFITHGGVPTDIHDTA